MILEMNHPPGLLASWDTNSGPDGLLAYVLWLMSPVPTHRPLKAVFFFFFLSYWELNTRPWVRQTLSQSYILSPLFKIFLF